jgi:hypothetical protein
MWPTCTTLGLSSAKGGAVGSPSRTPMGSDLATTGSGESWGAASLG